MEVVQVDKVLDIRRIESIKILYTTTAAGIGSSSRDAAGNRSSSGEDTITTAGNGSSSREDTTTTTTEETEIIEEPLSCSFPDYYCNPTAPDLIRKVEDVSVNSAKECQDLCKRQAPTVYKKMFIMYKICLFIIYNIF